MFKAFGVQGFEFKGLGLNYWEGQGELESRLRMRITGVIIFNVVYGCPSKVGGLTWSHMGFTRLIIH